MQNKKDLKRYQKDIPFFIYTFVIQSFGLKILTYARMIAINLILKQQA